MSTFDISKLTNERDKLLRKLLSVEFNVNSELHNLTAII